MTPTFLTGVSARLAALTATLRDLKDRVRGAAATEVGRAVADAVRDVLTAALQVRFEEPPPARSRAGSGRPSGPTKTGTTGTTTGSIPPRCRGPRPRRPPRVGPRPSPSA